MARPSLAKVMGGASAPDTEPDEDTGEEPGEYMDLAKAAFPGEKWTPERVAALKELIMSCMG